MRLPRLRLVGASRVPAYSAGEVPRIGDLVRNDIITPTIGTVIGIDVEGDIAVTTKMSSCTYWYTDCCTLLYRDETG